MVDDVSIRQILPPFVVCQRSTFWKRAGASVIDQHPSIEAAVERKVSSPSVADWGRG